MKKIILSIVLFLSIVSAVFSYEEVEANEFIKKEISKLSAEYVEGTTLEITNVFSIDETDFIAIVKIDGYSKEHVLFHTDGKSFFNMLPPIMGDYEDMHRQQPSEQYNKFYYDKIPNAIKQLKNKKCGELTFYVVDLNFDAELDYISLEESGSGFSIDFSSLCGHSQNIYFQTDFCYWLKTFAFAENVFIEFCILDGKRGFILTDVQGNFITVADNDILPEESYNPKKTYKQFYEYNPSTNQYELNENISEKQIANAIIPDDYFAYDGLDFSKLDFRLIDDDLKNLDKEQLRLMRNAVYARHGRLFKSVDLQSLFNCYAWYKKNPNYSDNLLTEIDKYNIELIKMYEAKN